MHGSGARVPDRRGDVRRRRLACDCRSRPIECIADACLRAGIRAGRAAHAQAQRREGMLMAGAPLSRWPSVAPPRRALGDDLHEGRPQRAPLARRGRSVVRHDPAVPGAGRLRAAPPPARVSNSNPDGSLLERFVKCLEQARVGRITVRSGSDDVGQAAPRRSPAPMAPAAGDPCAASRATRSRSAPPARCPSVDLSAADRVRVAPSITSNATINPALRANRSTNSRRAPLEAVSTASEARSG